MGSSSRLRFAALSVVLLVVAAANILVVPSAEAALPSEARWRSDVAQVMHGSHKWLRARVDRAAGKDVKLAINLDIDNSSLASHYDPGAAIAKVLKFTLLGHSRGVVLLFNTGRYGSRLDESATELESAGYPVQEVCGRRSASDALARSKQRCRRHFVDEGYTIIANIGNNATDFVGKNNGRKFRLPNYHGRLS